MAETPFRMSGPTLKVLKHFLEAPREARAGADITRAINVGASTLYPLLSRLEQHRWLTSDWETLDPKEAGRPRKRLYTLTALGQSQSLEVLRELQMPLGDFAWSR